MYKFLLYLCILKVILKKYPLPLFPPIWKRKDKYFFTDLLFASLV